MSIPLIQNQAAMARNADVGKIEKNKEEIDAKRKARQLDKERELTENRLNSLNEVIDENIVDHLSEEELEKRRKRSKVIVHQQNNESEKKPVFKDSNLGSNIDISV